MGRWLENCLRRGTKFAGSNIPRFAFRRATPVSEYSVYIARSSSSSTTGELMNADRMLFLSRGELFPDRAYLIKHSSAFIAPRTRPREYFIRGNLINRLNPRAILVFVAGTPETGEHRTCRRCFLCLSFAERSSNSVWTATD